MRVPHLMLALMLVLARTSGAVPVPEGSQSGSGASEATLERRIIPPLYKGDASRHQLAGSFGAIMSLTGAFSGITGFLLREDTHKRERKQDQDTLRQQQQQLMPQPQLQPQVQATGYRTNLVKRWWGGPSSSKVLWIIDDYVKPAGQVISLVAGTGWLATSVRDNVASRKVKPASPMRRPASYINPAVNAVRAVPQQLPNGLYNKSF